MIAPVAASIGLMAFLAIGFAQRLLFPLAHRRQGEHALDPGRAFGAELERIAAHPEHDRREKGVGGGEGRPGKKRTAEPL